MVFLSIALGFVLGALSLAAAEFYFFCRIVVPHLRRSEAASAETERSPVSDLDGVEPPLVAPVVKEGIVWVLEELPTRGPKEIKNKKGVIEVYPVKKQAKLKDQLLSLSDLSGSQAAIKLIDCTVVTVSGSDLPTKKWAKRYPIKLENKSSVLYNGSNTCYVYLETSWEKESWCKSLRLASCSDKEKLNWFSQLTREFHQYLVSLSAEVPSFLKPPAILYDECIDKSNTLDGSYSKVQSFLKKVSKKATKYAVERKRSVSSSANGERKLSAKTGPPSDVTSSDGSVRSSLRDNTSNNMLEELVQPSSPTCSRSMLPVIPDSVIGEKIVDGEGTLALNLLLSRLCFDAIKSKWINDAIKARIQRTLSNMRTPSYIGGVTCTRLDLGNLPPFVHQIRALPVDLNEAWTVEVDFEYSGGLTLDVETRVEIGEAELEKDFMDSSVTPSSGGDMTSDLLEGFEHYGNNLKSSVASDLMENRHEEEKLDDSKQVKSTKWTSSYASRWKAAVHSIANQVSQVPLSLTIRISSFKGTLRLHIKPPPSDQLWFGFTSMPEIEWNLDSCIGERKITNAHVALLIGNRFKAAIRENLVLPNYENISIPWMLAEKDDWVAQKVAPFLWANQEGTDTTVLESRTTSEPKEAKIQPNVSNGSSTKSHSNDKVEESKTLIPQQPQPCESSSSPSKVSGELGEPLLKWSESSEVSSSSEELVTWDPDIVLPEEDLKPKKMSRKKMLDLGKKMGERLGEKFEEQKRSIGEKGRSLVERMREKQILKETR